MRQGEPHTADFAKALADPAGFYRDPGEIVAAPGLSRQKRLLLLEEWAQALQDEQLGHDPENPVARIEAQSHLLRSINDCLATVEASRAEPPTLLARVWRRVTAD